MYVCDVCWVMCISVLNTAPPVSQKFLLNLSFCMKVNSNNNPKDWRCLQRTFTMLCGNSDSVSTIGQRQILLYTLNRQKKPTTPSGLIPLSGVSQNVYCATETYRLYRFQSKHSRKLMKQSYFTVQFNVSNLVTLFTLFYNSMFFSENLLKYMFNLYKLKLVSIKTNKTC